MWPFTLSGRLPIVALVGRYPANWLMGRGLIPRRSRRTFPDPSYDGPYYAVLSHVSMCYSPPEGRLPTCYSPVRRSRCIAALAARLACLKRAASVRSEPGSNSPLFNTRTLGPGQLLSYSFLPFPEPAYSLSIYRSCIELTEALTSLYIFSSLR